MYRGGWNLDQGCQSREGSWLTGTALGLMYRGGRNLERRISHIHMAVEFFTFSLKFKLEIWEIMSKKKVYPLCIDISKIYI